MPNVAFVRSELKTLLPIYETVDDCVDGDFKVKSREDKYLPRPNATDKSAENLERYTAYLNRAIFYNVTKATFKGMLGQIFDKKTLIELPESLSFLESDADGSGKSLEQMAKEGIGYLLKNARFGLLTEYPRTEGPKTIAEIEKENLKPTIKIYASKDIRNWRTKTIGSKIVYSLIVLAEKEIWYDDGFEIKEQEMFKVLRLDEVGFFVEIHKQNQNGVFQFTESFRPTDFNGNVLQAIPFEFCGVDDNDALPDVPSLYDIAVLNIGHYRNSADYEESCFITGQPTPYFSGLDKNWIDNVLKGTIQLGSRGAVPLPTGGTAGLLQSEANIQPIEAMKHKEQQFLALGAKLISISGTQKTATESGIDNITETSLLSSLSGNASAAFTNAIKNALQFVGTEDAEIIFKINNDFAVSKMSTAERSQLLNEWMKNAISYSEYRNNLRAGKIELIDDEDAQKEIEEERLKDFDLEAQNPANITGLDNA